MGGAPVHSDVAMRNKILKGFTVLFVFMLLGLACLLFLYYREVSEEVSSRIERGAIEKIIFSESPVYYDDGKSVIGVFFENTHRKYIHYAQIPPVFIKAIVASEDRNFFEHPGFDIKSLLRAAVANLRAGRVVQGGSTITQQTAKNIFEREKRSYRAKLKELIQALLLETRYSKEEILEMYINQFFVTGFGRGLEIASQYFFNKKAEDLDLVESAFIAGSVKSPNRYNPFTKKTEPDRIEARNRAKERKDYVLAKMLSAKFITDRQYGEAKDREIPFREGTVTYRLNVILDYIRDQLESDYFGSVLEEQGVDNIATSGIRIYTSVNKAIQEGALNSLRNHLPTLETQLSGYDREALQTEYAGMSMESLKRGKTDLPFLCRVTKVNRDRTNPHLMVAWDNGGGVIDYEGFREIGEAWLKGQLGLWASFERHRSDEFLQNFHEGDLVAVRCLEGQEESVPSRIILSRIPILQGAVIVLHRGMIRAMVGGFFDRFFNRASDAKRQLGSIFKPIVYTAALQLKWNNLDPLVNRKELFRFQNTRYVPKPDHQPQTDRVSMIWAGTKSENLASVWLLYHLTDHLTMGEFSQVADGVGLGRKKWESYGEYVKRIRDTHGVIVDREAILEAAFEESKKEIVSDLIFAGHDDALENLQRLHFRVEPGDLDLKDPEELLIYRLSFQRLQSIQFEMKRRLQSIQGLGGAYGREVSPAILRDLSDALQGFYLSANDANRGRIIYSNSVRPFEDHNWTPATTRWLLNHIEDLSGEEIWIDGLMPSKSMDLLQSQMKESYMRMLNFKRYDKEVLYKTRDFKTLVNLLYVTELARAMGISTRLDPVLSFPLGASSISIQDAALAYHTIMSGMVFPLSEEKSSAMVPIITRIEDRNGDIIWEYGARSERVLSERVSLLVSDILQMVMENGTGRGAKGEIRVELEEDREKIDIPLPCFGKTGTANLFTNSSFVGFIPGPKKDLGVLDRDEGYTVAAYVGYDDNRPMKGKRFAVYGASGALPLWIDTVDTITRIPDFRENIQVTELAFEGRWLPLKNNQGIKTLAVSGRSGLPGEVGDKSTGDTSPQVLADVYPDEGTLRLRRVFEPLSGEEDAK